MLGHATKREAMSSKILGKTCDVLKDNTRLIDLNFFQHFLSPLPWQRSVSYVF